jgi:hypothetical protein
VHGNVGGFQVVGVECDAAGRVTSLEQGAVNEVVIFFGSGGAGHTFPLM